MGCARRGELSVRVDHLDGCIVFTDEAFASVGMGSDTSGPTHPTLKDGSAIQPTISELVRTRLGNVATCLYNSVEVIDGPSKSKPTEEEQQAKFKGLITAVESERKALQLRRALVARRRELLSELSVRKEEEETSRRAEISRREREEEAKKLKEDQKQKELARNKQEKENIRIIEAKKYAQSLLDIGVLKTKDVEVCFSSSSHPSLR